MKNKIPYILIAVLIILILFVIICNIFNNPKKNKYKEALSYLEQNKYEDAIKLFTEIDDYKDAKEMIKETKYRQAKSLKNEGYITSSKNIFASLNNYKDTSTILSDDIFNIIGLWSYNSYNKNNYVYISLDFSDKDNLVKQEIYVGSKQESDYQQYKILDNDIYILDGTWQKKWHINSITSSSLVIKNILNSNEIYTLTKAS